LKSFEHLPDEVKLSIHNITDKSNDWLHDELNETTGELTTFIIAGLSSEAFFLWVEVVVTPKLLHEL
jgi:hypothetical protein